MERGTVRRKHNHSTHYPSHSLPACTSPSRGMAHVWRRAAEEIR
jgi:hypothetical protein